MKNGKQVAKLFNVHWNTLYRWIASGKIKAVKIGKSYFVTDEEIEYVKNNGTRVIKENNNDTN